MRSRVLYGHIVQIHAITKNKYFLVFWILTSLKRFLLRFNMAYRPICIYTAVFYNSGTYYQIWLETWTCFGSAAIYNLSVRKVKLNSTPVVLNPKYIYYEGLAKEPYPFARAKGKVPWYCLKKFGRLALYIGDLRTNNLENRLPFELQCWLTTHFEGYVELSSLPLYLETFGGNNMV